MSNVYIGQILQGGWNFAPRGTALCNGQQLSIAQNSALFSLLGTNFGGNGTTTFGLPDLRARSMMHWGQGAGLSNVVLGQVGGAESTTLNVNQMPAHTHTATFTSTSTLNASTVKATTQTPAPGLVLGKAADNAGTAIPFIYSPAGSVTDQALAGLNVAGTVAIGSAGGNQPLPTSSPYQAVTHVIALEGIFPSRS
jgi:microcystin-dependent protein